jgi:type I restriction enzyme S subunit
MKDTDWLADFPEDWEELRADFLCYPYRETVSPERFAGQVVAHYSIPQVQETGGPLVEPADDIDSSKLLIRQPTLLVSKLNPRKKTICIAEPQGDLPTLASGEFVSIQSDKFDQNYAYFVWQSEKVTDRLSAIVQSATRSHQRVNPADILKLPWKWPALATQERIASFLRKKTARIDALIAGKQSLLDRLTEKRQAIIVQAVGKGLEPQVPMKDSGIDWLGEIPAYWEVANIRRFATMKTGHTPSRSVPEYWDDCTIPWFTLADVWQLRDGTRIYIEETAEKISELGLANSAAELLPAGTVIFSRTASIGFSGIMPCPMATTQDFWNWICGPKLRPDYLLFLFRAMTQKFAEITNGSTHKTIYQPIAASLEICVPPLAEQDAISAKLKTAMSSIDLVRSKVADSVDRLSEYRSALITAAVTGQIEGLQ